MIRKSAESSKETGFPPYNFSKKAPGISPALPFTSGILMKANSVTNITAKNMLPRAGASIVTAEPEKDCKPLTLVYCPGGTNKLAATLDAGV